MADTYVTRCESAGTPYTEGQVDRERQKLARAPTVVAVAAVTQDEPRVPFIEQVCSASAAAQNALLAATALGLGSMWRTGDAARDPAVAAFLGLRPEDVLIGFLYLGTRPDGFEPGPRELPMEALVEYWEEPGQRFS
jgi:nitroreductase